MNDMVIFTRGYDLLKWLMPQCDRFPKPQRSGVTLRMQGAALDLNEALHLANAHKGPSRLTQLQRADASLGILRMYLRLCHEWGWLNAGQYTHVSAMVAEIGKLLGGWLKQTRGM